MEYSSIKDLLQKGAFLLIEASESSRFDAEILLRESLGKSREWMLAHSEEPVPEEKKGLFFHLVSRRKEGEAVSEILGKKEFFGREFLVNQDVLTPRPETEMIVEKGFQIFEEKKTKRVIDIGTGSGCIAISFVRELLEKGETLPEIIALDISDEALSVAKENAKKHEVLEKISFRQSDLLLEITPQTNDLFLANLPYIPLSDKLPVEVQRGDPALALFSGEDGLDAYRRLFEDLAKRWKNIPFSIVFEFHPPQKEILALLFEELFGLRAQSEFYMDYFGEWRGGFIIF